MEEYNNLECKKNKWTGDCSKETTWCFEKGLNTSIYGHLYNNAPHFVCCHNNLKYLLNRMVEASKL